MAILAAVCLIVSLKLPLWQIRLEAPQYRGEEALRIAVHPNAMRGDLKELATLNQYIGVHVPATLPQFRWLPAALACGAMLCVLTGCFGRSLRSLTMPVVPAALAITLAVAAVQANLQMRQIGHHRDHKTILVGVQDFTPPFLGTAKIAQFQVSSRFGSGAWLIGLALALQSAAALACARPLLLVRSPLTDLSGDRAPQFKHTPVLHGS